MYHVIDLIKLFDQCFFKEFNTVLMGGADEPVYLPAGQEYMHHRVIFTRDYFASALHEVSHWCVAGEGRRRSCDYGYWYAPDGRSPDEQKAFERVEVKPQALEWIFTEAVGGRFRVSADNLDKGLGPSESFKAAIASQAQHYCLYGLPERSKKFALALQAFYQTNSPIDLHHYQANRL